jgi:hypothetical protein
MSRHLHRGPICPVTIAKIARNLTSIRDRFRRRTATVGKMEDQPEFSALELARKCSMQESAKLSSLSIRTLERNHADKIVYLSKRRKGMRLGDVLNLKRPTT